MTGTLPATRGTRKRGITFNHLFHTTGETTQRKTCLKSNANSKEAAFIGTHI
jgi:hypothetical protein